jgi:cytidine deaminase
MCLDRGVAAIVEDKGETAFEARDRGLVSLLLDCPWNSAVPSDEMIIRVRDWPDIYQHLLTNASLQRILAPEIRKLLQVAEEASKKAHSPYSRFDVGAALKMIDGKVIAACNVESASLGLTCCAERSALFKAVSEGYRPGDVVAVGIAARPRGGVWRVATPCGACRQLLSEFSNNEFPIVVGMKAENEAVKITNLDYYLPDPFRLDR